MAPSAACPPAQSPSTQRNVLNLKPGANDVRVLVPGVYFVRETRAQAKAQAIRKVIVLQ